MKRVLIVLLLLFVSTTAIPSVSVSGPSLNQKNATVAVEKVSINTGSEQDLTTVPGIGPQTAMKITEYRKKNGPFKSVDELTNVAGIGEKSIKKIKKYLSL